MNIRTIGRLSVVLLLTACANSTTIKEQKTSGRELITVQSGTVEITDSYPASIEGRQDVRIMPQVSGKIEKVCVREGDRVSAGQALFVIDRVPFEAAVRVAKANVLAAKAKMQTAQMENDAKKALFESDVVSEYDYLQTRNAYELSNALYQQACAEEVNASNNLSYTVVKSPVNGVVGMLPFRAGSLVGPDMTEPLTSVSDNSTMYVYFAMGETALRALVRTYGSVEKAIECMPRVRLRLSDGSVYEHEGQIESISGILNKATGTVTVRCAFPNAENLLYSGSTGNVLVPHVLENVIVVPQSSVYEIQGAHFASKVVDGKVSITQVTIGRDKDGKEYVITSGLEDGDTIVGSGAGLLHDGDEIGR